MASSNTLTLKSFCDVVGGRLNADRDDEQRPLAARIVTDSRQVQPGDVFWALRGPTHSGADFIDDALKRGAQGIVAETSSNHSPSDCWTVTVPDALAALWDLARWRRRQFKGRVVGVTGSVGKTTTQRMIHSVLSTRLSGTASPRSYNNHVGVPLTMLHWNDEDDYAVVELGASAPGEIAALAELTAPRVGVITEIGDAHLGGFGDLEGVARAKFELFRALPHYGWAVVNGDRRRLRRLTHHLQTNLVTFGRGVDCNLRADDVQSDGGTLRFRLDGHPFHVPVWGRHHLSAALASISVGRIFGLDAEDIAAGLARYEPAPMRCEVRQVRDATIIQDTYNASPLAMRAALDLLRDFEATGRRVVVCGDMRELGRRAAALHRKLGADVVCRSGADLLVAVGRHAEDVVSAARDAGMPKENAVACHTSQECAAEVAVRQVAGDVILVKGSRALALEAVVDALEGSADSNAASLAFAS